MGNPAQRTLISKVLLIIGGAFSILLWLALLFYGFFLGGSPAPAMNAPLFLLELPAAGIIFLLIGTLLLLGLLTQNS